MHARCKAALGPARHRQFLHRRLLLFLALLLAATAARAATLRLAGPAASWSNLALLTNSVRAATIFTADCAIASTAEVDTCLALLPDWSAWRASPAGALDVWLETVADASNRVCLLLGDPAAPELTITRAGDWQIVPAGAFPADETATAGGPSTNRLHLTFYPAGGSGHGVLYAETQMPGGAWTPRPDLLPAAPGWVVSAHDVPNWPSVGVALAGPAARLTLLQLRWQPDATLFIIK
jgi:hypothetical protein